jgi:hypothetical protein
MSMGFLRFSLDFWDFWDLRWIFEISRIFGGLAIPKIRRFPLDKDALEMM